MSSYLFSLLRAVLLSIHLVCRLFCVISVECVLFLLSVWGQFVGRLVKGPEVDYVKRRGAELFLPIQNQNGDILVMLAAEVSFRVALLLAAEVLCSPLFVLPSVIQRRSISRTAVFLLTLAMVCQCLCVRVYGQVSM